MEKNQQSSEAGKEQQAYSRFPQNQPGQQLPPDGSTAAADNGKVPEKQERHSESSLPQNDNETLGTP